MAKPNVFILSILVMAASLFSICHSLTLFGILINQFRVRGTLTCSLDGDPNAPPVSNGTVYLLCGNASSTLAQALTDPAGTFSIAVNIVSTALLNPSDCRIRANLPTGSCEIYPPDGTVTASVKLVNIIFTGLLTIADFIADSFVSDRVS